MPVFPQIAVYPLKRELNLRTVVNALPDGKTVVFADSAAASRAWELQAKGLTASESNAVEAFFRSVQGSWQTFTFLDPGGNLLAQSESFNTSAWMNDPLLQLTAGVADPLGTTRATHVVNTGQALQAVAQGLPVPGNFQYALSVWARSSAGSNMTLGCGTVSKLFRLTTNWQRLWIPVNAAQSGIGLTFRAQLDPGGSLDLFGMQVDAQAAPSDYKATGATAGVYLKARFATDGFTVKARSTDVYDATIRIVSTEG